MQKVRILLATAFFALASCESSASQAARGNTRPAQKAWVDSAFFRPAGELDSSIVALPRIRLNPNAVRTDGKVTKLAAGADLQRAIARLHGGDVLELPAGANFRGPIVLSRSAGDTGWITVRTEGADALVPPGTRATPATAAKFAKILAPSVRTPAIEFGKGAFGFRLTALEVVASADPGEGSALVAIGAGDDHPDSLTEPREIILDRLWAHGVDASNFRRCLLLNGASTAVIDSWISDCHGKGFDSQAIAGWNGSGPYYIANNFLEGAGENLMFGGADPQRKGVVPSDIEIVRNHFFKPPAWRGVWSVKNLFELKIGKRVLVEGNVFENNWVDGQDGFSIVLKSVNQDNSAPWSETSDVTFRSNIVRNVAHGLNATGSPESAPTIPMSRVYVTNNLFERIGNGDFPGGRLIQVSGVDSCTIVRNTGLGVTHGVVLYGNPMKHFVLDHNVFGTTQQNYDVWNFALSSADGAGYGTDALKRHTTDWSMKDNFIPGVGANFFPGNWYAANLEDMKFKDYPTDLRLADSSRFANGTLTQQRIGVDFVKLARATKGAVVAATPSR